MGTWLVKWKSGDPPTYLFRWDESKQEAAWTKRRRSARRFRTLLEARAMARKWGRTWTKVVRLKPKA